MLTFRTTTVADLPILNHISITSKAHWGYPQEWLDHWKAGLTLAENHLTEYAILVAELEDQVIGFCAISEQVEQYQVEHLWVMPEHIGKGYGKQLLDQALSRFTSSDKPIIVEADPNAETFYQRQGFVTIGQVESYPPGRFLPIMQKED